MLPVGLMYLLTHIILVWLLKLTEPNFPPIFFYTLLKLPRSLDEISNIMRNISAKL
jgi:hypothetical protein